MPHGKYMRGTRRDYALALSTTLVLAFVIAAAVGPAKMLARARDERRSDDVRHIMAELLQLSADHPEKYEALMDRLQASEGEKYLLGDGISCGGSWGAFCPDSAVADDCLPSSELFADPGEAESKLTKDPQTSLYGAFGTGYYLMYDRGALEVGSCAAQTGAIHLEADAR